MKTQEMNSNLIMYVILDFLSFTKGLQECTKDKERQKEIKQQEEVLQSYAILYLKQAIGEEQTAKFINELSSIQLS